MNPVLVDMWRCSCGVTHSTLESAAHCCLCNTIGCDNPKAKHRILCELHLAEHRAAEDAEILAGYLAMPVVDQWDGPVYDIATDTFYGDLDALVEAWWDEDIDPVGRIVRCCSESRMPVPDLEDFIAVRWAPATHDGDSLDMSPAAARLVEAFTQQLEAVAPITWGVMSLRVDPAAIEAALNAISDRISE